jgi:hypothetical protein
MTEEKVYTPTVIEDQALPNSTEAAILTESGATANETYTPKAVKDTPLPRKVIAHETIASSFNTMTKKILGVYELLQQGAIQIGKFVLGVSGEVKISPAGIIAKDSSGNTSFALDGETGNATFRGTVTAGNVNVIDETGLVSLSNFSNTESKGASINQQITTTYTDWTTITNSAIKFTADRALTAIILFSSSFYLTRNDSNNFSGDILINAFLDDVEIASNSSRIIANAAYTGGADIRAFGPADTMTTLSNSITSSKNIVNFFIETKETDIVLFKNHLEEVDLKTKIKIIESLIYDIIKKLEFGNPFVEHIAKKTYVKTKSNLDNSEIENIEN